MPNLVTSGLGDTENVLTQSELLAKLNSYSQRGSKPWIKVNVNHSERPKSLGIDDHGR